MHRCLQLIVSKYHVGKMLIVGVPLGKANFSPLFCLQKHPYKLLHSRGFSTYLSVLMTCCQGEPGLASFQLTIRPSSLSLPVECLGQSVAQFYRSDDLSVLKTVALV